MIDIQELIGRLNKVRQVRADRWMACCPAHDDSSPSLQVDDKGERILIHCFAGCEGSDVLEAIGLNFSALYPDDDGEWKRSQPRIKPPDLEDLFFVAIYKADVRRGVVPTDLETARYKSIIVRIR